jgi:peptide chain release factor 1
MIDKLKSIHDRYLTLEENLGDPEIIGDMEKFRKINKEYKDLVPIVQVYKEYDQLLKNRTEAKAMLNDDDDEMRSMAKEELQTVEPQIVELEERIKYLLIPRDPEDSKDVIFEIRSGTGGDEASLFAGDLYRMYTKYFDNKGLKTEILEINEGTVGGYNKISMEITGDNVYGLLKFESGAHRVQRIPDTESKGRVHTSAATVVVMPKLEMDDVHIRKEDLRIDTYRASGAGGQHVNKTESAVRITHLPTGTVSECQDGRSQIQNKELAMQQLYKRIFDSQKNQHDSEQAAKRKSLVGSGDRSDKIRTYNFPQNRLTDHRINLTLYSLEKVLEGEIEEVIEALQIAENTEKLKGEMEMG